MSTLVLATLLVLVATACGGTDDAGDAVDSEDQTQESPTPEEGTEAGAPVVPTVRLSAGEELVLVYEQDGYAVEGEQVSTSPGPTIRVRKGATVTITFENAHYLTEDTPFFEPHNLTLVAEKDVSSWEMEPLWGVHVGGFDDPDLATGDQGSVTFTAEQAGRFFYVCALSDHIAHGMWGRFIVER